METQRFGIGAAIGWGFKTFVEHILFFLSLSLVALGILSGVCILVFAPGAYLLEAMHMEETVLGLIVIILTAFGFSLFITFLNLGFTKIQLELRNTGKSSIKTLFSQGDLLFRGWAANFLFALLIGLGTACFIIPGIYFACRFYFYGYALVDKNLGVFESFKEAARLSEGARWGLFGLSIINSVLNVLPFALIVTSLAQVYAYKKQGELVKGATLHPLEPSV